MLKSGQKLLQRTLGFFKELVRRLRPWLKIKNTGVGLHLAVIQSRDGRSGINKFIPEACQVIIQDWQE